MRQDVQETRLSASRGTHLDDRKPAPQQKRQPKAVWSVSKMKGWTKHRKMPFHMAWKPDLDHACDSRYLPVRLAHRGPLIGKGGGVDETYRQAIRGFDRRGMQKKGNCSPRPREKN